MLEMGELSEELFLTCIPLHPIPGPILQSCVHVLPCKRAGGSTKQM